MEDLNECWSIEALQIRSMRTNYRRPAILKSRCLWIVMQAEGFGVDLGNSIITITGPSGENDGVAVNLNRSVIEFRGYILVPVCIDQGASA